MRAALSAQLFRAGALQPRSGRDRPDRQHGRRCPLAAVLQRRLGGDAHRRGERDACSFTRSATCCATTRDARRPRASGTTGAGTPPATARSTTISTRRDCRCRAIRRCPASMDCRAATPPRSTTSSCRRRRERTAQRRRPMTQQSCTTAGRARTANGDPGNCRPTTASEGGVPGVDSIKAELVRREVARAHRRDVAVRRRRPAGLAPLGPRDARAEGRLHGDHPPRGAQGACATARSAATTAPTGGRIAGRPATASSSWRASTSRGRGRVS